MGLGLTFESFIRHLITEPVVALGSIGHSIKDIAEMLYFYFSQLSLTACYVILFVIAVRFLLKKAPKDYSYGLWVIVYFKLLNIFHHGGKACELNSFIILRLQSDSRFGSFTR
jgi:hypothetical protein